jgi:hypothetical protein
MATTNVEFPPPTGVVAAVREHTSTLTGPRSPCLALPDIALEEVVQPHELLEVGLAGVVVGGVGRSGASAKVP